MATSTFIAVAPFFVAQPSRLRTSTHRRRRVVRYNGTRACMPTPEKPTVLDMPVGEYNGEEKPLLPIHRTAKPPGLVEKTEPLDGRVLFGEFLSTFLFVYLSVTAAAPVAPGVVPPPQALTNGAVIAAIACSFMPVSGAHLNPAVTAALLITRRVSPIRALAFIPVQLAAAASASFMISSLGVPILFSGPNTTNILKALADEAMPMAIIVFVVFQTAVATKEEGGVGGGLAALYIGLAVLACAGTFTQGIFNPARAFAPAVATGNFTAHWVFWVGPFIGALFAALVSEHLFLAPAVNRKPNSWLYVASKKMDGVKSSLRALGLAGILAYGILNCVLYSTVMSVVLVKGGDFSVSGFVKAFVVAWSLSNATKPIRLAITIALAPIIDRTILAFWRARKRAN